MSSTKNKNPLAFLRDGGEMGALMRAKDWSKSPAGLPESWPDSLKATVSLILNSRFPMFIFWGPDQICFYNDAYRPSLGKRGKHPEILGERGIDWWKEIWDDIKPLIDQVMNDGEATWREDQLLPIFRNGRMEDVYWTYSYSPINGLADKPQGVLVTCTETTEKVLMMKKLKASNRQFYTQIMQAPVGMAIMRGPDHIIEIANKQMLEIWNKTTEETIGYPVLEAVHEARGQGFDKLLDHVYNTGERFEASEMEVYLSRGADVKPVYLNFVYQPFREEGNDVITGIVAIAHDVTSLVEKRKAAEASENEFRQLANLLPDLVWTTDPYGKQIFASRRWKQYTGIEPEGEVTFKQIVHPDDLNSIGEVWSASLASGEGYSTSVRLRRADGIYEWFRVQGDPVLNENGEIEKWIGTYSNIHKQKEAEQKLITAFHRIEESERRFRNVADSAPVMIWMTNIKKLTYFVNSAWLNYTGRTAEQECGKGWLDNLHPDDHKRCIEQFNEAFKKREQFYIEYRLKRHDGVYRWISETGRPRFTAEGVFEGFIGACMDIHEQVVYHQALRENEQRLNIVVEASELATFEFDVKSDAVFYSERYSEIFGHQRNKHLSHQDVLNQILPEDWTIRELAYVRAFETGYINYTLRILWPDKTLHWIEVKGRVFFDDRNQPDKIIGTVRDMTADKIIQQELQESEKKFRTLSDSMPQFVWTADKSGQLNYFNEAVFKYSGFSSHELMHGGWIEIVHPEEREENIRRWKYAVETGTDFILEHRFRQHDGTYRWQLSRAIPQRNDGGGIEMWVGTSTDIQEQKMFTREMEKQVSERTHELKAANDQLEMKNSELQKMNNELQSFAYISSHDLQEPLRKIQTFANRIIEKELDNLTPHGRDYFSRIEKAARRMQTLIEDLLAYSRTNTTERVFELTNLNNIVSEVKHELRDTLSEKKAVIDVDEMGEAKIIPFQFRQLIHNLIGNSLKFSNPERPPHIKLRSKVVHGKEVKLPAVSPDKPYFHISISDNGIGFDPMYRDRIFEVFQRLHGKEQYKGTGIGLAIVKKIVENHNGSITATGSPDEGATFDIYIPE